MEFFINKGATLPILKLELIQDGRLDYKDFYDKIQNSNIFFTMADVETGVTKIGKKEALCISDTIDNGVDGSDIYYLAYQFSERDTKKEARYVGKFIIEFLDGSGTLIVPIRDELFINVKEGSIKK